MVSFEIFVKSMPPSLSELKVLPSFCFAFKIPDDVAITNIYCFTRRNGGAVLSARNDNFFLVEISSRSFSALTPVLANKSPDGGGPTPPPTSGGDGKKGKKNNPQDFRFLNVSL